MLRNLHEVEFNEIYKVLISNPEPMNTYDECLEFLQSIDMENIREWVAKSAFQKEVMKDLASIIDYYLEENGE